MFRNLFGEKPVYPDPTGIAPIKVPAVNDVQPAYQIGRTVDNRVTLRLGDGTYYSTLTMTDEGVDALIRMLEAAKNQPLPACDSEE